MTRAELQPGTRELENVGRHPRLAVPSTYSRTYLRLIAIR